MLDLHASPGLSRVRPGRGRAVAMAGLLALGFATGGCAGQLPYAPEGLAPFGPTASADFQVVDAWLWIAISAPGYRVDRAVLIAADGGEIPPETLLRPASPRGPTVALGVGGDETGERYADETAMGVTLGDARQARTTRARFRLDAAGPAPWRLRVTVAGLHPVEIVLDPAKRPTSARS